MAAFGPPAPGPGGIMRHGGPAPRPRPSPLAAGRPPPAASSLCYNSRPDSTEEDGEAMAARSKSDARGALKVWIAMGSDSDLAVMEEAARTLEAFGIPYEI